MLRKIFFITLLIPFTIFAQNVVKGTMDPVIPTYESVVVYQLKGAKQVYVNYGPIDKATGNFKVEIPDLFAEGMYRMMYDFEANGYVDFIYSKKNVEFNFDPTFPSGTTTFINSEQNKNYNTYLTKTAKIRQNMDSLQLIYFNEKSAKNLSKIAKKYVSNRKEYLKIQEASEAKTTNSVASSFIKSAKKYYAPEPIKTAQEYLNSMNSHYFDFINFNDETLINSVFLSEKAVEYIFYLNSSEDVEMQTALYKNSLNKVMGLINNPNVRKDVLTSVIGTFAKEENSTLVDYSISKFYNKLPENLKDQKTIDEAQEKVRLSVGKLAPDFSFEKGKELINLYELDSVSKYVIVFWSTTCSHCLVEVPQLYKYIKDRKDVEVLAIALEQDELGFNHHTIDFKDWTNILGLNKWQNPIARKYDINATPSYFVLDSNKKIIAKPEYYSDVKKYFDAIPVVIKKKVEATIETKENFKEKENKLKVIKEEIKEGISDLKMKEDVKKKAVQVVKYKVKKGDTLYSISKTYNLTIEQLKKLNNLSSNNLSIGQIIKIKG